MSGEVNVEGLGEEELRDMMEEFIGGMRNITFNELDTMPEGQALKYVGAPASRGLKDLTLAVVHKIRTLGLTASLLVGIDEVVLDPRSKLRPGKEMPASRTELYTSIKSAESNNRR